MIEAVLISIGSKIIFTIATPAFMKAYAIWGAQTDLDALGETIKTIQAKLEFVVKSQDRNSKVKIWMDRIGDVLYEADDLFDEVAANQMLKQQIRGNKLLEEVKSSFTKVASNHSIVENVRRIRQSLEEISKDEAINVPENHQPDNQINFETTGWYINPLGIVGREEEKKDLCEFLLVQKVVKETVPVIAIVGIGGLGKTTLAQLICCDTEVQKKYKKIWWACISNLTGETEVLLTIFQSISGKSYDGLMSQLNFHISRLVKKSREDPTNYLLVLDDVCETEPTKWYRIISLLSTGAKGSKIIVTTRDRSVANVMHATKIYDLLGLPEAKSWELFKRIAFQEGQEKEVRRISLGKEIVKKCANVPLAIMSIATLLCRNPGIKFWLSVNDDPNLRCDGEDSVMSQLRLTCNRLLPEVMSCFAYCSLFPRQHKLVKEELIYLWTAQGYVKPKTNETIESVGNDYFNQLLNRNFFQELEKDENGEVIAFKMHNLFHQLAQQVAGVQSVVLTEQCNQFHKRIRHLTVGYEMNSSWTIPEPLFLADRLRSSLFMRRGSLNAQVLHKLLKEFKFLRALDLENLKVDRVSDSVGDLKHLRYLNISENKFTSLPSSITKLVNLLTLDISRCVQLEALPDDFWKLINLRFLNAQGCCSLTHMPPRFKKLACLENMSYFNVGEDTSSPDKLAWLKLGRKVRKRHQLPTTVRVLKIENLTETLPYWGRKVDILSLFPQLVKLHIFDSSKIECLPPFRCLSSLKDLQLSNLAQLQYIEQNERKNDGRQSATTETVSMDVFFPGLECLILEALPNLEGWLEGPVEMPNFTKLFYLKIEDCPKIKSIPQSVCLQTLDLRFVSDELVEQLLPVTSYHSSAPDTPSSLTALTIWGCDLLRFQFEFLTSLQSLQLGCCCRLNSLYLAPKENNMLEELQVQNCSYLESYGHDNRDVDWDSLPKLRVLIRDGIEMQREGRLQHVSTQMEDEPDMR